MMPVKIVIEKEPQYMYHKFHGCIYAKDGDFQQFIAMFWFNTYDHSNGVHHFIEDVYANFGILDYLCELVWATETVSPEQLAAEALI